MAAHTQTSSGERTFLAGAATSNITPALGTSLDGPIGRNKAACHVHDDLHARCLAVSDGRLTLAVGVCDSTMISGAVFDAAKRRIREHTGLPGEQVMLTATHSHSVPRSLDTGTNTADRAYLDFLAQRVADGVIRAVNQLAPARLGCATVAKPEHVHNRRWFVAPESLMPNPFGLPGDKVRMNPPPDSKGLGPAAGPVDPGLTVLGIRHADGAPLALLGNYGLHYIGGVPAGHVSADYYGRFAAEVEQRLGGERRDPPFVALLANGASGDVNNIDVRKPRPKRPPYSHMHAVALDMAHAAMEAWEHMTFSDRVELGAATHTLELGVRRPTSERLTWAKEVMATVEDESRLTWPQIYAREALFLNELPATTPVFLQAFRLGSLGMVGIPSEVFAETGLAVKQGSSHAATCVMSLANGYHGYLPSPRQHELGGYETWPARSSSLDVQAEAHIRREAVRLLSALAAD